MNNITQNLHSKHSNKYRNKKVTVGGKTFDSKKEYTRYCELSLLEKAGVITDLQTQIKFVLIPTQKGRNGKVVERECSYIADFVYCQNGDKIVEDTKGFKTPEYKIKRKLMRFIHNIAIKEV